MITEMMDAVTAAVYMTLNHVKSVRKRQATDDRQLPVITVSLRTPNTQREHIVRLQLAGTSQTSLKLDTESKGHHLAHLVSREEALQNASPVETPVRHVHTVSP